VAEDIYLDFGIYLFQGKGIEVNDTLGQFLLGSEYGANANAIYTSIHLYF
jgi:hypothetical protein